MSSWAFLIYKIVFSDALSMNGYSKADFGKVLADHNSEMRITLIYRLALDL